MWVPFLGQEDPLEKEMATHSSAFACKIPWTEEPGGLQPVGLQKSWTWLSNWTTTVILDFHKNVFNEGITFLMTFTDSIGLLIKFPFPSTLYVIRELQQQWWNTHILRWLYSHRFLGNFVECLKVTEIHLWNIFMEKEMATHSSVLAWRIPGMEEPGGLPSMGSHRVGHDWSDLA